MKDLFEHYEELPVKVTNVIDKLDFENDYRDLEKAVKELNELGYHFEYYLDGTGYNLREVSEKDIFITNYTQGIKDVPLSEVYPGCNFSYDHSLKALTINGGTIYNVWTNEIPLMSKQPMNQKWFEINHFVLKPNLNDE